MTESPVPRRVQVVPLGFEYARLRDPVAEWRADVVVAVEYPEKESELPYVQEFLAELEADDSVDLRFRECDIFDLYDTLGTLTEAITAYPDDEVWVNVSAGSKITAIAGMIACMATGARPIYARPDYGPDAEQFPEEPRHEHVAETFELPQYPIERPSNDVLRVLAYVDAETTETDRGRYRGVSKHELIEFAREASLPFVADSESTTEKGYYRLLERHVVAPARENGWVDVEQVGRRKFVTLTDAGRNTVMAFRHLADGDA